MINWTTKKIKILSYLGAICPGVIILINIRLGITEPKDYLLHQTGLIALYLLMASLSVTPIRYWTGWNSLIPARKILGISVFVYATIHMITWWWIQKFKMGTIIFEMSHRFYLMIGFLALMGLLVLTITSFSRVMKILGGKLWNRIHTNIYWIAILIIMHGIIQTKIDADLFFIILGFFYILMLTRIFKNKKRPTMWKIYLQVMLSICIGVLMTMGSEYMWYREMTRINPLSVLEANWDFEDLRPAMVVGLNSCLIFAIIGVIDFIKKLIGFLKKNRRTKCSNSL